MNADELIGMIHGRRSPLRLIEPTPIDGEITRIIEAAAAAPDHGRLQPWRFTIVSGEGRRRLGEAFAKAQLAKNATASASSLDAERAKPMRSPMIIVVSAKLVDKGNNIPAVEQLMAVAAAVQNMMLAAHSLGYATWWKTGAAAYSSEVKLALGLASQEEIVAFLHIGTADGPAPPPRPKCEPIVSYFRE